jgi:hypothetical protein
MFQSTMLKRAARLAAPAAAAAATTVGVVSMTSSNDGDDRNQQQVRGAALCDDKKDESVLSMLGDIQARVSHDDLFVLWILSAAYGLDVAMRCDSGSLFARFD